jgi:hypothetical protein
MGQVAVALLEAAVAGVHSERPEWAPKISRHLSLKVTEPPPIFSGHEFGVKPVSGNGVEDAE